MDYLLIYGLSIIGIIITFGAQIFIKAEYSKYSKVDNTKNMTGKEAARYILDINHLSNIDVVETSGYLSDHYSPDEEVIRLSSEVYKGSTISAVSIAAHECGHALQDKDNFIMLRIRHALVPITNLSSRAGYLAILLGCIFGALKLIYIGIFAEIIILLFQLVTLPVEIDASRRALKEIKKHNLLTKSEQSGGRLVLIAAALTYVASVLATLLEIFRLVLMFTDRD